ncbi:DUF6463 family protein [Tenacibaculum ovolyticum]|jgi:hypothetical protein|uniref:DUF6463 family protein n=1 Tax=Tenacibaculum ovolyticum TaxID=104270 RepID=UPI00040A1741|nr:DUF6463 family protein [Tenacibaculum ovolyticum]
MKILKKITNGILLIIIGLLHTQFTFSAGGFQKQILHFSKSYFYKISDGMNELPAALGYTNFEYFATFWFLYFGIILIPLGLLVHFIEKQQQVLPQYFTITYLLIVLLGCYMVPNSGITFFMLPQAVYMLISNNIKAKKNSKTNSHI